jgi:hypothetical protein
MMMYGLAKFKRKSDSWFHAGTAPFSALCRHMNVSVFVVGLAGRPARPRTEHDCHHDTKVKPEAATAVIELLMMGGKTPETC